MEPCDPSVPITECPHCQACELDWQEYLDSLEFED